MDADVAGPLDRALDASTGALQTPRRTQPDDDLVDMHRPLDDDNLLNEFGHAAARHLVHLLAQRHLRRRFPVGGGGCHVGICQSDFSDVLPLDRDNLDRNRSPGELPGALALRELGESGVNCGYDALQLFFGALEPVRTPYPVDCPPVVFQDRLAETVTVTRRAGAVIGGAVALDA